jgi:hypothetical protein
MTISKNAKLIKKLRENATEENLCEANKLLLKRMESNPDEFHLNKGGKWADYLNMLYMRLQENDNKVLVMLSTEECSFMWDKYTEVAKANLHKTFMQRILRDQQSEDDQAKAVAFSTTGRFAPRP